MWMYVLTQNSKLKNYKKVLYEGTKGIRQACMSTAPTPAAPWGWGLLKSEAPQAQTLRRHPLSGYHLCSVSPRMSLSPQILCPGCLTCLTCLTSPRHTQIPLARTLIIPKIHQDATMCKVFPPYSSPSSKETHFETDVGEECLWHPSTVMTGTQWFWSQ